jgi:hypothetical protein
MRKSIAFLLIALPFCVDALAERQIIGDWAVEGSTGYTEASTSNESGSMFGFLCGNGSCAFYLDTKTNCGVDGTKTPMLVNADAGSTFVMTTCVNLDTKGHQRQLATFQDVDILTSIASGTAIGFAIPMANGQFKIVRFSLSGAVAATNGAAAAMAQTPRPQPSQLRDSTM